jgi:cytoskeleton protein RodZ
MQFGVTNSGIRFEEPVDGGGHLHPRGVGALLRETRLGRGEELRRIATRLKIRYPYLAAIEEGRFDKLPGITYAVGFVRTYAEHLGLDGTEIVRRFKQETAGVDNRTELVFPEPSDETNVPGGAILLISLVLAIVGYAGWFYLTQRDDVRPELVAEVPHHLASPVASVPLPAPGSPAPPAEPAEPVVQPTREVLARFASDASTDAPRGSAPATPDAAAAARMAATPTDWAPVAEPPAVAAAPSRSAMEAHAATVAPPRNEPDVLRMFGATGLESRIVIRAAADSWVQIQDADGNLLLTRVLRAGDGYRVPDRPGITMRTGNAGGLEIFVDGHAAPPVGPIGGVRRNVALDPDRLVAGSAIPE